MKRPLLLFLYAAVLGMILAYYGGIAVWQLCVIAAAALFVLLAFFSGRRREHVICAAAAVLVFTAAFARMDAAEGRQYEALRYEGSYAAFTGTVTGTKQKDGYVQLYVRIDCVCPATEYTGLVRELIDSGDQAGASGAGLGISAPDLVRPGSTILYKTNETVLVTLETEDEWICFDAPGRRVVFSGSVETPSGIRNLFGFDYARYLKAGGAGAIVRCSRFRFALGGVRDPLRNALSRSKGRFFAEIRPLMAEEEFSVASGLIFGSRNYMDEDQYEQYRRSGISHILAVSGLHVGLLYAFLTKLMKGRGAASAIAICAALLCYALLSELSVSVLRASFMVLLRMLAFRLRRRYDIVSAASLCSLVFCFYDPYTIFDSGFQLSFAAAYAIGIALPWTELRITEISDGRRSERFYRTGMAFAPGVMIQLGMMPLIIYDFLTFSPISFAVNPAAVWIAGLELPAGLAAFASFLVKEAAVSAAAPLVASLTTASLAAAPLVESFPVRFTAIAGAIYRALMSGTCGCIGVLSRLLNVLSAFSARFSMDLCAPPFGLLILYYICFFFFFSDTRAMLARRKRYKSIAAAAAAFALCVSVVPYGLGITLTPLPWRYSVPVLSFVDVGQGDCVHIQSLGANILVDGGGSFYSDVGSSTLLPYLLKNGVRRIDLAIVTHPDMDHSKGLEELSRVMAINTLVYPAVYPEETFEGIAAAEKLPAAAGDIISAGGAKLTVLLPARDDALSADANANSLVMMLEAGGFRTLLTADMDMEMESRLLRGGVDISCEVIKAAHHGSAYSGSEAFILAADPLFEAISCGRNNSYGHPSASVIDLASGNGIIYGRTDEDGALLIRGVYGGVLKIRNAAGDRIWHIPTDRALSRSIRSGP